MTPENPAVGKRRLDIAKASHGPNGKGLLRYCWYAEGVTCETPADWRGGCDGPVEDRKPIEASTGASSWHSSLFKVLLK